MIFSESKFYKSNLVFAAINWFGSKFKAIERLSWKCNNDCIFCLNDDDREVSRNIEILEDKKKIGIFCIGEPTLDPNLKKYVKECKNKFAKIAVSTNGRKLSEIKFAKELVDYGIDLFYISLHAPNPRIHDRLTRSENSFQETIRGIKNLTKLVSSNNIIINYVVTKQNLSLMENMILLMNSIGIKNLNFNTLIPIGKSTKNLDQIMPKYSDIVSEFESISKKHKINKKLNKMKITLSGVPACLIKNNIPLINNKNFENLPTEFSKNTFCIECKFKDSCRGIYKKYIDNYGFKEFINNNQHEPQSLSESQHASFAQP